MFTGKEERDALPSNPGSSLESSVPRVKITLDDAAL